MAAQSEKLYRLRVGERVFEKLSVGIIVNNIRKGKLKREHEIANLGSDKWTQLGSVPQLAKFFQEAAPTEATPEQPAQAIPLSTVEPTFDAPVPDAESPSEPEQQQATLRYDIRTEGEEKRGVARSDIVQMIRKGELKVTDMVRPCPDGDWEMAGDLQELHRYFELRRKQIAEKGYYGQRAEPSGPPFYTDLGAPFIYIGNLRFLFNLIAILMFMAIAFFVTVPIVSGPIMFLTSFYLYAYYFRVVSNASSGSTSFPDFTDVSEITSELFRPGIQFFLTRMTSLLPLIIYIYFIKLGDYEFFFKIPYVQTIITMPWSILFVPVPTGRQIMELPSFGGETIESGFVAPTGFEFLYGDLIVWALLFFWLFYVPISLMRQASYGEFWPALNLVAVAISIGRAFGPYLALIVFMLIIDFIGGLILIGVVIGFGLSMIGPAGEAVMLFQAPIALMIQGITIFGTFLKMYFIGRFLYQNSERMGWY